MGGRGGTGGRNSAEQTRLMKNIQRVCAKYDNYSTPVFITRKDGSVEYKYTVTRTVVQTHGGKMYDVTKDKFYTRTETHIGEILKSGVRKIGKTTSQDEYIGTRKTSKN